MKIFWILWFTISSASLFPQANSVLLKDMTGQLIASCSSLSEAYNSLPDSITQSYLIELHSAYRGTSEIFPVSLGSIPGSSHLNRIIIKPAGEVTISAPVPNNTILDLNGCSYLTIDGRINNSDTINSITIENTFQNGPATNTIVFRGGTKYNTIKYCNIAGYTQYESWGPGVIQFRFDSWGDNPQHITIENCRITGGARGILLEGNSVYTIKNCIIEDFSGNGIFIRDVESVRVIDNIIRQNESFTSVSRGIYVYGGDTIYITGNKILNLQSDTGIVAGVYVAIPLQVMNLFIVNNFISLYAGNPDVRQVYGIAFAGNNDWGSYTAHFVYQNTVFIGGKYNGSADNVKSACLYRSSLSTSVIFYVKHNIFINMRYGGMQHAVHSGSMHNNMTGMSQQYDYNIYYASGNPDTYCAAWDTVYYNNILDYRSAASPQEYSTLFRNVEFVAPDDLHLTMNSWQDPELKAPIEWNDFRTDIDGDQRSYTYKGADELTIVTGISEEENGFNSEFKLHNSYPNPFNSSTVISYYLPEDERVTIKLFNILGREIRTLFDGYQLSGTWSFSFTADDLASGVYLIRAITGRNDLIQKVLLIK